LVAVNWLDPSPFARYATAISAFLLGQIVSITDTWMQAVAQSWLVYELTSWSSPLGSVALCDGYWQLLNLNDTTWDCQLSPPFLPYSWVNQKVQSSVGSTLMLL
jgi:hypothetical protein